MILNPGEIDDFGNWLDDDCMARYMEDATPPAPDPEDSGKIGRRQFYIIISTGVIEYLKAHQNDAFVVHLPGGDVGSLEIR